MPGLGFRRASMPVEVGHGLSYPSLCVTAQGSKEVLLGGDRHRVIEAVEPLRREFDRPLRIEDLARPLGMSLSGFHHHFKAVTGLSPLQFQKQLRLQEARRLLLGDQLDAAGAGHRVGYDDASHFTRDYKRLFGAPPLRDAQRQRAAPPAAPGL